MIFVLVYIVVYALVAGWMYGKERDEAWFGVALFWPLAPFAAIILAIGYVGYRAQRYFDK
jgi:hypothetical protein